jgi:hypothetical protein
MLPAEKDQVLQLARLQRVEELDVGKLLERKKLRQGRYRGQNLRLALACDRIDHGCCAVISDSASVCGDS